MIIIQVADKIHASIRRNGTAVTVSDIVLRYEIRDLLSNVDGTDVMIYSDQDATL